VKVSARRSAAIPCRPVCADCSYSRSSVTFCGVWDSHGTLNQDIDRPTQLHCLWPQKLEPTTASPPTARTVAIFIQAPAQDPSLPYYCAGCSCVSYTAVRRCCNCCEFGTDYKCADSTQLNSTGALPVEPTGEWTENTGPFR